MPIGGAGEMEGNLRTGTEGGGQWGKVQAWTKGLKCGDDGGER